MITQRTRGFQNALLVCQAAVVFLVLLLAGALTFTLFTSVASNHVGHYMIYSGLVTLGLVIESANRDKNRIRQNLFQPNFIDQHRVTFRQTVWGIGTLLLFLAATKDTVISRLFLVTYVPMLYGALLVTNYSLPRVLAGVVFRGVRKERLLLVGSAVRATGIKSWLENKKAFGFQAIGLIGDDTAEGAASEFPLLGKIDDLENVIRTHGVTQVILIGLPECTVAHGKLIEVVERLGIRLMIFSNLEEKLNHPAVFVEDDGLRFITLRQEPLESPLNRVLKKLVDIGVALPVVIFLLPLVTVFVWLLQRLQSPGPVFYRQVRAGIQNQRFEIFKFRTMHANNADETRQASLNDDRVFAAGKWLRRLSIDELPQFLNVLRGQMSVIGPRPHLVEHNAQFAQQMRNYHIRAHVKPGITGLAQVRGFRGEARNSAEIKSRVDSDISYLENWRLALDFAIIGRTIWQVLFPPRSAY